MVVNGVFTSQMSSIFGVRVKAVVKKADGRKEEMVSLRTGNCGQEETVISGKLFPPTVIRTRSRSGSDSSLTSEYDNELSGPQVKMGYYQ